MVKNKIKATKKIKTESIVMNKQIDQILQKRMDRKDFLKHVGMGFAVLTGTAGLVKMFSPQSQPKHQVVSAGYGASAYGGRPTTSTPAKV